MRLCITGTSSQGKSTLVKDFLEQWPEYTTPETTYRDVVDKKSLSHNTNKDTQWKILDKMVENLQTYSQDDNVIFDRGPIDNLAYTMWKYDKGDSDIDDAFVKKSMELIKESMAFLDIIFFVPTTKVAPIEYDDDADLNFIYEVDNILKAIKHDWDVNAESKIFDHRDKPGFIDIFGAPHERIQMIKLYIGDDGKLIGGDESSPILSEEEIKEQEMLKAQFGISDNQSKAFSNPDGYQ